MLWTKWFVHAILHSRMGSGRRRREDCHREGRSYLPMRRWGWWSSCAFPALVARSQQRAREGATSGLVYMIIENRGHRDGTATGTSDHMSLLLSSAVVEANRVQSPSNKILVPELEPRIEVRVRHDSSCEVSKSHPTSPHVSQPVAENNDLSAQDTSGISKEASKKRSGIIRRMEDFRGKHLHNSPCVNIPPHPT